MKTILILKGLPASGKSTFAKEYVKDNKGWVRLNNDELSSMLFGPGFIKGVNDNLSSIRLDLVCKLMAMKKNIVIDNTNLHPDRVEEIERIVNLYNANSANTEKYEIKIKSFTDVPVAECIRRNRLREHPVPEKVIYEMYHAYILPKVQKAIQDAKLPKAMIVDIDGTIARNVSRNIYDHSRYYEDEPITEVLDIVLDLEAAGNKIIFLTGRDDDGRDQTLRWLRDKAGFKNYECLSTEELAAINSSSVTAHNAFSLLMRPASGDRNKIPDTEYKEAIFNEQVKGKFYISAWFEDRIRNIEMARHKLGITAVFQVGEGNF